MENFIFYSPTEFLFGKKTEQKVGETLVRYGARKVLVVYGGGSIVRSGLLERVEKSLREAGLTYCLLSDVQPNPLDDKVYEGVELVKREGIDFLLPVGGGSVIDTAKAIAAGALYEGDFWDFFIGKAEVERALPVGVILTIPAAGSEGSGNTVITRKESMAKLSVRTVYALRPRFAIMNPELTYTLPPYQTAAGIVDMMVHIMERYFSNTEECEVTDRLCEGTLKAIVHEANRVMRNPEDYQVRSNIMWAGTIAHNGTCGVGREEDWASHFMEHELSALYDVTHGAGLAVIVPAWMEYLIEEKSDKLSQFAVRVMEVSPYVDKRETARVGVERLRQFFYNIGMPINFEELGAKEKDIPVLVEKLHQNKGETIGFFKKLNAKDTEQIYRLACKEFSV